MHPTSKSRRSLIGRLRPNTSEQGSVLVAAIIILATLTGITAASLMRSSNTLRATKHLRNSTELNYEMRSIISLVLQEAKDYAWGSGQDLDDLLPTGSNRFESWYSDTYNGITYDVSVGDNTEAAEGGSPDYTADVDNRAYFRIAMSEGSNSLGTIQVLMSPGAPATAGVDPPGELPGSAGICYGFLNFTTRLSTLASDQVSGFDMIPEGFTGNNNSCPSGGGDCVPSTPKDQFGIATTSWLGTWNFLSYFGIIDNYGAIIGEPTNMTGTSLSVGKPSQEDCDNYDDVHDLADNMLSNGDPALTYYNKTFGTKTISGNRTYGTDANPEVLYVKSGLLGFVRFSGDVDGVGILIADGKVHFDGEFNWKGVVIVDANGILQQAEFNDTAEIYGATMINRPLLGAELGTIWGDLEFNAGNTNLQYSSEVVDWVLSDLDPNYTPPASATPGQAVAISSIQLLD